jgi:acetyltransferase-like isoleucine patch superfamily enzyme
MSDPPVTSTSQPIAAPIYPRARGWRRAVKPLAVRAISAFWVRYLKWRLGDRVHFGRNFQTNGRLVIQGPGRVEFGDDVNAWCHAEKNVLITYTPDSRITIGGGTRLNGAGMMAYTRIEVGPRCILGSTIVFDSDFHPLEPSRRHDPVAPVLSAPIRIGENVWLAGQSAVLKGVTVGDNSVVAFRAVVSSAVPPNVVVAGNPARVVKSLEEMAHPSGESK